MPATRQAMQKRIKTLSLKVQQLQKVKMQNEITISVNEPIERLDISEPTLIRIHKSKDTPYIKVYYKFRLSWKIFLAIYSLYKKVATLCKIATILYELLN